MCCRGRRRSSTSRSSSCSSTAAAARGRPDSTLAHILRTRPRVLGHRGGLHRCEPLASRGRSRARLPLRLPRTARDLLRGVPPVDAGELARVLAPARRHRRRAVPRRSAASNCRTSSRTAIPTYISGTFGDNAYQLVFFLIVLTALLGGISIFERRRTAARFAPVMFVAIAMIIFLAQYRALLVTTILSVIVIAFFLTKARPGRGLVIGTIAIVGFLGSLNYVASHFPRNKLTQATQTFQSDPWFFVSARIHALSDVASLYSNNPRFILTGTGPATFSSRAWRTFANLNETRTAVAAPYAKWLNGGQAYETDVADKYTLPRGQSAPIVQGSHAVTSPLSSYTSLLAEVGLSASSCTSESISWRSCTQAPCSCERCATRCQAIRCPRCCSRARLPSSCCYSSPRSTTGSRSRGSRSSPGQCSRSRRGRSTRGRTAADEPPSPDRGRARPPADPRSRDLDLARPREPVPARAVRRRPSRHKRSPHAREHWPLGPHEHPARTRQPGAARRAAARRSRCRVSAAFAESRRVPARLIVRPRRKYERLEASRRTFAAASCTTLYGVQQVAPFRCGCDSPSPTRQPLAVMGDRSVSVLDGCSRRTNRGRARTELPIPVDSTASARPSMVLFLSNLLRRKGLLRGGRGCRSDRARAPPDRHTSSSPEQWEDEEPRARARERSRPGTAIAFASCRRSSGREARLLRVLVRPPFPAGLRPEGHPRVVLEALAAGLPIVTTDRGTIVETVGAETSAPS